MNIFRRPMFRGGPVDSRGTGITSGLGYAKGGSVEPQATFGVGNNANRDASGREKHAFFLPAIGSGLMAAARFLPAAYRGFKTARAYQPFSKNLGFSGRVKDLFTPKGGLSAPMADKGAGAGFRVGSFLRQNPLTTTALLPQAIDKGYKAGEFAVTEGAPFAAKNLIDLLYPGPSIFKEKGPSDEEKKLKELEQQQQQKEEFEKYLAAQAKIENEKQKSKISGEEDIEANKEKYAELLGGDKARGEDISNMLLSFAGKALAPEATVKSAFGEFAAEQAKTPSKRSKVEETAAALAINEYIAGKKSKAELDRFFAETDYKKQLLSKRGKENVPANIIEAAKSFGQGYKAVDYGLQMSFGGRTNKMDTSEGQTIDKVPLVVDNIDQIFIEDEAPYRAVRIIIEDGKLIRDRIN